eukprot:5828152-Prorocentrum_lima.AAC.1
MGNPNRPLLWPLECASQCRWPAGSFRQCLRNIPNIASQTRAQQLVAREGVLAEVRILPLWLR